MAAAGEYSSIIAETADVYDRCSGVMCKKGLILFLYKNISFICFAPCDLTVENTKPRYNVVGAS